MKYSPSSWLSSLNLEGRREHRVRVAGGAAGRQDLSSAPAQPCLRRTSIQGTLPQSRKNAQTILLSKPPSLSGWRDVSGSLAVLGTPTARGAHPLPAGVGTQSTGVTSKPILTLNPTDKHVFHMTATGTGVGKPLLHQLPHEDSMWNVPTLGWRCQP